MAYYRSSGSFSGLVVGDGATGSDVFRLAIALGSSIGDAELAQSGTIAFAAFAADGNPEVDWASPSAPSLHVVAGLQGASLALRFVRGSDDLLVLSQAAASSHPQVSLAAGLLADGTLETTTLAGGQPRVLATGVNGDTQIGHFGASATSATFVTSDCESVSIHVASLVGPTQNFAAPVNCPLLFSRRPVLTHHSTTRYGQISFAASCLGMSDRCVVLDATATARDPSNPRQQTLVARSPAVQGVAQREVMAVTAAGRLVLRRHPRETVTITAHLAGTGAFAGPSRSDLESRTATSRL